MSSALATPSAWARVKAFLEMDFSINLEEKDHYFIRFGAFNLKLDGLKVALLVVGAIFFIYLFATKSTTYKAGKTVTVSSESSRSISKKSVPAFSPVPKSQASKEPTAKPALKSKTPEKPRSPSPEPARRSARGRTPKK